jgi:hypothetical protein
MSKFCTECGTSIRPGGKFCGECQWPTDVDAGKEGGGNAEPSPSCPPIQRPPVVVSPNPASMAPYPPAGDQPPMYHPTGVVLVQSDPLAKVQLPSHLLACFPSLTSSCSC